eukprot:c13742_g1_i1.p1 GENE.c13742_g1_i1~~c13742_g1_i1.p1  ORF type:complete len:182 (-),score=45.81 c13742_g1_i1:75-593(-)
MANAAAKKRAQENKAGLSKLNLLVLGFAVYMVLIRVFWQRASFGGWAIGGVVLVAFGNLIPYLFLRSAASVDVSEDGSLIDSGSDMYGGMCEYYWDVLYLTWAVQLLWPFTNYVFLVFLLIPAFALWQFWFKLLKPWIFNEGMFAKAEQQEDERSKKKREKLEKRASRGIRR